MERAVDVYGIQAQIIKAIEEMAELTKELCKDGGVGDRVDLIAEEMADVEIMLEQLRYVYRRQNIDFYFFRWMDAKLERLRLKLEQEER
ncbi:MAG: hypothetical protein LIR46_05645 [Bacteroidota bacterium]|nr:hypothetical protein [Bacteroidota bacterium]